MRILDPIDSRASYLNVPFDNSPAELAAMFREAVPAKVKFDTLVSRGLSGALVLPGLARELGVNYAVCRKPDDGAHSMRRVEGIIGHRWLFVDDLVDSGTTLMACHEALVDQIEKEVYTEGYRVERYKEEPQPLSFTTEYVGAWLYLENHYVKPGGLYQVNDTWVDHTYWHPEAGVTTNPKPAPSIAVPKQDTFTNLVDAFAASLAADTRRAT